MSNFKTPNSIFHALILTAGFGAATSIALTATAQTSTDMNDAFTLADSNGDKGLDRNEFPVFISLKSGNSTSVSLVSDSTSYEIPFVSKDKNQDGLLDAKELKLVERDVRAWDAPQADDQAAPEPATSETVLEIVEEVPVMEAPAVEAPVIEAPEIVEPTIEDPVTDELTIEPLQESSPDVPVAEPMPEETPDPEMIEPQPEG